MSNEHHRQSPKPDAPPPPSSSSSPIPLMTPNSSLSKLGDLKVLKQISEECGQQRNHNQNRNKSESITLMHPAFQNVLHKQRKYYGTHGIDAASVFDKNYTDRDARHCNNLLTNAMHSDFSKQPATIAEHSKSRKTDYDNADMSQDSSCSEEIDLTSNGCIDFSNNNNDINSNQNRKSEKCAMNNF